MTLDFKRLTVCDHCGVLFFPRECPFVHPYHSEDRVTCPNCEAWVKVGNQSPLTELERKYGLHEEGLMPIPQRRRIP